MSMFGKDQGAAPPSYPKFQKGAKVTATFQTSMGEFTCRLFADECPMTVGNFVGLATGETPWTDPQGNSVQKPLYDGTVFHRVIPKFMIQGGDPRGNGTGGPGYKFADEIVRSLRHDKPGVLSMANAGKNTNGSQFFVTDVATPWLDGMHTVFGEVTSGIEVVHAIANVKRDSSDRPLTPVVLQKVTVAQS